MKNLKSRFFKSVFLLLIFFTAQKSFCETEIVKTLSPDSFSDLTGGNTQVEIKTDKKNAKVYINGDFSGLTPLTITGLIEGIYNLKIIYDLKADNDANGRIENSYALEVKKNLKQNFYIALFTDNADESHKTNENAQHSTALQKSGKYKIQHGPLADN